MKKEELTEVTVESPLLNKKVAICPIYREGGWLPKNHDGAFLHSGATITLRGIPHHSEKRSMIDPLTEAEKEYFTLPSLGLGIKMEDLSIYKKQNYWSHFQVALTRDPIILDLLNPLDYLRYKFLLAQTDIIAPSWGERYEKGTYKFAVKDDESDQEEEINRIDLEMEVNDYFKNIQGSIRKMSALLTVYYQRNNSTKRVPANSTSSFLKTEIHRIIKSDLKKIHEVIQDPYFTERVLIAQAIEGGVILKISGSEYQIVGQEDQLNLKDMMDFLRNKKNQPIRLKIEAQLDNQS